MTDSAEDKAGLSLRLLTGDLLRFRPGEFVRMVFHRRMLATYAAVLTFLILLDANGRTEGVALELRVPFFALGVVVALVLLMLPLILLEHGVGRRQAIEAPLSPFLFVSTLVGLGIADIASRAAGTRASGSLAGFLLLFVFYYIVTEGIALLTAYRIVPSVLADLRGSEEMVAVAVPAILGHAQAGERVRIGGRDFAAEALVFVAAEGNYVSVVTDGGRALVPGPMGVAVDALPERLGVQVHRSWWVARRAVAGVRSTRRSLTLRLKDGSEVPVAQSRREEVLAWLAEIGIVP